MSYEDAYWREVKERAALSQTEETFFTAVMPHIMVGIVTAVVVATLFYIFN